MPAPVIAAAAGAKAGAGLLAKVGLGGVSGALTIMAVFFAGNELLKTLIKDPATRELESRKLEAQIMGAKDQAEAQERMFKELQRIAKEQRVEMKEFRREERTAGREDYLLKFLLEGRGQQEMMGAAQRGMEAARPTRTMGPPGPPPTFSQAIQV